MRYQVNVYHGGESLDETYYTNNYDQAQSIAMTGEHSEIIEL